MIYTRLSFVFHSCYFLKAGVVIVFTTKNPGLWLDNLARACSNWFFTTPRSSHFTKAGLQNIWICNALKQALCVITHDWHEFYFGRWARGNYNYVKCNKKYSVRWNFFLTCSQRDYKHGFGSFKDTYNSLRYRFC